MLTMALMGIPCGFSWCTPQQAARYGWTLNIQSLDGPFCPVRFI